MSRSPTELEGGGEDDGGAAGGGTVGVDAVGFAAVALAVALGVAAIVDALGTGVRGTLDAEALGFADVTLVVDTADAGAGARQRMKRSPTTSTTHMTVKPTAAPSSHALPRVRGATSGASKSPIGAGGTRACCVGCDGLCAAGA